MVAVVLVFAAVAATFAVQVKSEFSPTDLFSGAEGQAATTAAFRKNFGNTDNTVLVLVEADDVLAPQVLDYLQVLSETFESARYAADVTSLALLELPDGPGAMRSAVSAAGATREDGQRLREFLRLTPLLERRLISEDHTLAVVAVMLEPHLDDADELSMAVGGVREGLAARPPPRGVRAQVGGLPPLRTSVVEKLDADRAVLFPSALAIILLLLLLTFRWFPAVLLPTVVVGVSVAVLMGGMQLAGESLNIINNIIPVLIIVIGISDSVHFVNRYGEELSAGQSRLLAARSALKAMAVALFLTSATTAAGFASLVVSQLSILQGFGIVAALGVMIAYFVTVTFLPTSMSFFPRPKGPLTSAGHGLTERLLGALVEQVIRNRGLVVSLSFLVLVVAAVMASKVPVDAALSDHYDDDDPTYQTARLIGDKLGGTAPVEVSLTCQTPGCFAEPALIASMDRTVTWIRQQPGVIGASSYADLLRQVSAVVATTLPADLPTPAPLDLADADRVAELGTSIDLAEVPLGMRYVSEDRSHARISVQLQDVGGNAIRSLVTDLRQDLRRNLGNAAVQVEFTGEGYASAAGLRVVTKDFLSSLFLAVVVIFALMTFLFRSLRLGLLSIPPNILPLLTTLGYLYARGITLNPGTVIIFAISVGLAVDGSIHFLTRFREEVALGQDTEGALLTATRGTGKAVVVSYVSLIAGFSVLQLSSFLPIRLFGELICVTVLGCLLSTLLVLPAMIALVWPRSATQREAIRRAGGYVR